MLYIKQYNVFIEIDNMFNVSFYEYNREENVFQKVDRRDLDMFPIGNVFLCFSSNNEPARLEIICSAFKYNPYIIWVDYSHSYYHLIIDKNNVLHSTLSNDKTMSIFAGEPQTESNFWPFWTSEEHYATFGDNINIYKGKLRYYFEKYYERKVCYFEDVEWCRYYAHVENDDCFRHLHYLYHNNFVLVAFDYNCIYIYNENGEIIRKIYGAFEYFKIYDECTCVFMICNQKGHVKISINNDQITIYCNTIPSSFVIKRNKNSGTSLTHELFLNNRRYIVWDEDKDDVILNGSFDDIIPLSSLSIIEKEHKFCFNSYIFEDSDGYNVHYVIDDNGHVISKEFQSIITEHDRKVIHYPNPWSFYGKKLVGCKNAQDILILSPLFDSICCHIVDKHKFYITELSVNSESKIYGLYNENGDQLFVHPQKKVLKIEEIQLKQTKEHILSNGDSIKCLCSNKELCRHKSKFLILTIDNEGISILYDKKKILSGDFVAKPIPCVNIPTNQKSFPYQLILIGKKQNDDILWSVCDLTGNIIFPFIYKNITYVFGKILADDDVYEYNKTAKRWERRMFPNGKLLACGDYYFAYDLDGQTYIRSYDSPSVLVTDECFEVERDEENNSILLYNSKTTEFVKNRLYSTYVGSGYYDDVNHYYNDNLDMDQQSPEFWDNY